MRPDYTISKGAMLSLTRQIALDYAKFNIRVNAAIFGLIITPFAVSDIEIINAHEYTNRVNKIPLKRAGSAFEAAKVIFFLASDESSFLTGASIVADGGVSSSVYV
jgi:NAD(P)-dependent dehydrogenase (short-subunit alcohol dehydrogenase family)